MYRSVPSCPPSFKGSASHSLRVHRSLREAKVQRFLRRRAVLELRNLLVSPARAMRAFALLCRLLRSVFRASLVHHRSLALAQTIRMPTPQPRSGIFWTSWYGNCRRRHGMSGIVPFPTGTGLFGVRSGFDPTGQSTGVSEMVTGKIVAALDE